MRVLVIGYGSIGSKHVKVLKNLGCRVAVVSQYDIDYGIKYEHIDRAINTEKPDYIVIANKTCDHSQTLIYIAELGFQGIVLVEKPLFNSLKEPPPNNFQAIFVAYNLRFHPVMQRLYNLLKNEKILFAQAYCGQYLPLWRPQSDYRLSYSASKAAGGGVLRDLSHELDYLNWILSGWQKLTALGGHFSHLQIDSDDIFSILFEMSRCPVAAVHINYLDRVTRREILVNTDNCTIIADLANSILEINGTRDYFETDENITYRLQHQAILNGDFSCLCSIEEGLAIIEMIEAIEQSVAEKEWITNDKALHHMRQGRVERNYEQKHP
ncbi:Gfo/Idh/MocA family oxidoreductase [Pelotomaculum terephthalicicum JT]|uniref:Gfo/Idh/MocA family protein n=1 Tax=Pelotomaculum TaxID=191373 RepID=UPI0009CE9572|nr:MULTISPECIES: Gfo/Idh/MocA family oxidoreductase [Pelotomaculum]MCG9967993.1 Gfo/Idh/MocA family oxidoreductase [Pelotomaculum terephthalicicum JT]OPX88593.1 MAG: Oxidoreductase family, NAD-binding Rossmann fold [Pelotomaculum sp. PtaB.Bin117]OPY63034.1 MAG: Oxidoreductase family, NAD-binding Rossmann fold [Pelotomaculum sp. PtaU1.Bin065]